MEKSSLRTDKDFTMLYEKYVNMVYRLCFTYLKNEADTEDAVQEVFLKLLQHRDHLMNEGHIKAWLIVTASNHCKNTLKYWWRKRKNLDDCMGIESDSKIEIDEMMELILALPNKYKAVVYMYYYEGYNTNQISQILHKPASTIRGHLRAARKMLKKELEMIEGGYL